ncbi:MAG: hypothetical protein PHO32_03220 [Candidatus Cloacimonetes bacterium]|nr:hypothetical protein [Candidatus Cloacimonadota bacterium]
MVFTLLALCACDDSFVPAGNYIYCSLNPDGSELATRDNRLYSNIWGSAYYVSDDLVFYISNKIYRRILGGANVIQISPDSLDVTGFVIDQTNQMLFYTANGDIYRSDFNGQNLQNLSLKNSRTLSAPSLSLDGIYLVAIGSTRINRLDLLTGEWLELPQVLYVRHAVYVSSEDAYYYYGTHTYNGSLALYRLAPDTEEPERLIYHGTWNSELSYQISSDQRYFGLLRRENYWSVDQDDRLQVYDRLDKDTIEIGKVFSYAFSPVEGKMLYSAYRNGLGDLNLLDLATGEEQLLFDGIYTRTTYSGFIDKITWRSDAGKIFYAGWEDYRNPGKSLLSSPEALLTNDEQELYR